MPQNDYSSYIASRGLQRHKSGVYVRPDTIDFYTPGEMRDYKSLEMEGCRVLDLGGHIGCFANYAVSKGALCVCSVEPFPDSCIMFDINTQDLQNVELIQAAVVASSYVGNTISLYLNKRNPSSNTIRKTKGRDCIEVDVAKLPDLLQYFKPNVVKLDIEGSEYELTDDIVDMFPKYGVIRFAAELHLNRSGWDKLGVKFCEKVGKLYNVVQQPKLDQWNSTGVWELK